LYTWKTRTGSKATYAKLIKVFEQTGYKSYADVVRRIAHISNSDTSDSSGSGEEQPQIEQPQTYPDCKQYTLPQVGPQPMSESTEVYVMVEEENLPKCRNLSNGTICLKLKHSILHRMLCRNICLHACMVRFVAWQHNVIMTL
jgi:hypothetical protein